MFGRCLLRDHATPRRKGLLSHKVLNQTPNVAYSYFHDTLLALKTITILDHILQAIVCVEEKKINSN